MKTSKTIRSGAQTSRSRGLTQHKKRKKENRKPYTCPGHSNTSSSTNHPCVEMCWGASVCIVDNRLYHSRSPARSLLYQNIHHTCPVGPLLQTVSSKQPIRMGRALVATICGLGTVLHHATGTSFAQFPTNTNNQDVMPSTVDNESAVLGELKETIRNQAKEIEQLKTDLQANQTPKAAATHAAGHGHGGGEPTEEEVARYLGQPFHQTSLARVGWLGIFLASLSATAVIMNTFEHTLEKHIELSYFVPLLAGHGGNTGGQTIGTVLSALSSGAVKPKDAARVILKEAMAGVMSGLILGIVVGPVAYKILGISFHVALVLFFTMPLVSTIASSLGAMIPFICIFMGLDPSVIAAPAMTSFVDICGLMSYFMIANYIFKLYGLEL